MFAENDTARAMREIKLRDPTFNLEAFTKTIREYIIPEILDAFLTADLVTLKQWCSEGVIAKHWYTEPVTNECLSSRNCRRLIC